MFPATGSFSCQARGSVSRGLTPCTQKGPPPGFRRRARDHAPDLERSGKLDAVEVVLVGCPDGRLKVAEAERRLRRHCIVKRRIVLCYSRIADVLVSGFVHERTGPVRADLVVKRRAKAFE